MNLCVNIGNHSVLLGLFNGWELISPLRVPHKEITDLKFILPVKKINRIIISSVVPVKNETFIRVMESFYGVRPEFITPKLIKGTYPSIGADRIANMLGGKQLIGLPVCVIDFGTATTIDVLGRNEYKGGVIMPGVELGAKALYESTALLPEIRTIKVHNKNLLQKSTRNCIESGIYNGECFRIEGIIKEIKNKFRPKIVVTGGAGKAIANSLKLEYNPWLTLYGLNSLSI